MIRMPRTSDRGLRAASIVLAMSLSSTALAALGVDKPAPSATPDSMTVDIVARSPGELEVYVKQTWVGDIAHRMRQSLDAFFGGADGTLTPSELDRIALATQTDMATKALDWIDAGGQPYTVTNVTVTFGNATGRINDTRELSMAHTLLLSNANVPADRADIRVLTRGNGTLSMTPPPGWHVASFEGLSNAATADRITRGGIAMGGSVVLGVAPGEAPAETVVTPTDGSVTPPTVEPTESASPGSSPVSIPGPSIPVVLALGAALAIALRRGARERRQR